MKISSNSYRSNTALAKKIRERNHSQDQERYDRKLKRTLHDLKDVTPQQLFANGSVYDIG